MDREASQTDARKSPLRVVVLIVIGFAICGAAWIGRGYIQPETSKMPKLHVGGTSAAALIFENGWGRSFRVAKGVQVEYDSAGSTEGINRLIDGSYAIAFSHTPVTDEQRQKALAKGGEIVQLPIVLCAVVPAYNVKELNGMPPLKFSGEALGDIFLGKIDHWNHPTLKALNPDAPLPDTKITVVHRADSSGTTLIFTDFLEGASPAWQKAIGRGKSKLDWPVGEAKERSQGVAEHLIQTDGSIGYLDLVNVDELASAGLQYGAVENRDKSAYIHAEAPNITAALSNAAAELRDDMPFSFTNRPGKDSYPISGSIWAVFYKTQPADRHQDVTDFLGWVLKEGQAYAPDLSYAPLPPQLIERAKESVKSVKAGN